MFPDLLQASDHPAFHGLLALENTKAFESGNYFVEAIEKPGAGDAKFEIRIANENAFRSFGQF